MVDYVVETQKCTKCGKVKPITEFYKIYTGRRTRSQCKQCHLEYTRKWRKEHRERSNVIQRDWYKKHPEYKIRVRKRELLRLREFKQKLVGFAGGKCVRCEYSVCNGALEFHHLSRDEKENFKINSQKHRKKLMELINLKKVILLCANCHREEHFNDASSGRKRDK